jgi:hypothetical protein
MRQTSLELVVIAPAVQAYYESPLKVLLHEANGCLADSRSEAAEALRGLVDAILLVPAGNALTVELKGNLAAMFSAAQNAKRSPEGDL